MIANVLSNLFARPATRPFPAVRRTAPERARGSVAFRMDNCVYCGACALRCPSNAIEVDRTAKTLTFDLFRCIACACCEEACKKDGVHMDAEYHPPVSSRGIQVFRAAPVVAPQPAAGNADHGKDARAD